MQCRDVGQNCKEETVLAQITWLRVLQCVIATNVGSFVRDGPVTRQLRAHNRKGTQVGGRKLFGKSVLPKVVQFHKHGPVVINPNGFSELSPSFQRGPNHGMASRMEWIIPSTLRVFLSALEYINSVNGVAES